jgi:dTDP-4-amino-4,6-dideoxygalactose transaminase
MLIPACAPEREYLRFKSDIDKIFSKVMGSGKYLQTKEVEELEGKIAEKCHRKYAIAVNSCTDALTLTIQSGEFPEAWVILPALSFVATAEAAQNTRTLIPYFIDVDENYLMKLKRVDFGEVLIYVNLFGTVGNFDSIEKVAKKCKMELVEDAAQSFGAWDGDRPSGSLGDFSCLSFDPTKPFFAPGSGGMILTDNSSAADFLKSHRQHGKTMDGHCWSGFNSQMSSLTAAILNYKLSFQDEFLDRRRGIAKQYSESLKDVVKVMEEPKGKKWSWSKYVIQVERRDELKKFLIERGIECKIHYDPPLSKYPFFGNQDFFTPMADRLSKVSLSLPIFSLMERSEVEVVINTVLSFFDGDK